MALYDSPSMPLERERSWRVVGPLWQRIVSALRPVEDPSLDAPTTQLPDLFEGDPDASKPPSLLRFPVARRGYDREAVEEYVSELETELADLDRELVELRGGGRTAAAAESEIKRIGEQTSAVLIAANEQREEILSTARAEADRRIAEATAAAQTITAQTEARLRGVRAQIQSSRAERTRLLEDVRRISAALAEVANSADHPTDGPS